MPEEKPLNDQFNAQTEQAILASFKDPDAAQKAVAELKNIGVDTAKIDRVSPYPGESARRVSNPITGEISSLGDLTLGMDAISSRDASVLMAADPSASGLSAGDQVSGENILLTAVCSKEQVEQAIQIIRTHGGDT